MKAEYKKLILMHLTKGEKYNVVRMIQESIEKVEMGKVMRCVINGLKAI